MGLYNFKARFVPLILNGTKRHTIRATRKSVEKVGDTMHLYTGLRQKGAKLLMRAPCVRVQEIQIQPDAHTGSAAVRIDGDELDASECEQLARMDGFQSFGDMLAFWRGRLPFTGHIIHWDPESKARDG